MAYPCHTVDQPPTFHTYLNKADMRRDAVGCATYPTSLVRGQPMTSEGWKNWVQLTSTTSQQHVNAFYWYQLLLNHDCVEHAFDR